jgi:hypothetical protein
VGESAHLNKTANEQLKELRVAPINLKDARRIVTTQHYMKTWPNGCKAAYGLFHNGLCKGVMTLGYASHTEKKIRKFCTKLEREKYIELQRTWISDELGHNTESWMMARVMESLKKAGVWLVLTHSGGCKDDVGFIFQASGWLYFGFEKCDDFYETKKGEYKNMIAPLMFGRVPPDVIKQGKQEIGRYLFGDGRLVNARRHLYLYPINKGLRRRLIKIAMQPPKNPAQYRFQQNWTTKEEGARGADGGNVVSGSIPDSSATQE